MLPLIAMFAVGSVANADIRPLLRQQGFNGPLNGHEAIKYVGHVRGDRHDFQIYLYREIFRAASVDHGVNRLIVIRDGRTLVGTYDTTMPTKCRVRGDAVICTNGTIKFGGNGPPSRVFFDGNVEHIAYGNRLKN